MVKRFFFLIVAVVMMVPGYVFAGGGQSYPNGAEAFLSGALPPPGFYFLDYAYYYNADSMKDNDGNDIDAFDNITAVANVFRGLWVSETKILGGNYGMHLFLPVLGIDLNFKEPVGPGYKSSYDDVNLPYVIYSPFVLGWHLLKGKLHFATSLADVFVPTGQDDRNMAGVRHDFWTVEPVFAVTYLPGNWEFSGKFMYDFNTTQDDCATVYGFEVDRDPGQEFHVDYSVSYAFAPSFRFGVSGYYYRQTTDDSYDLNPSIPGPVQGLLREDEGHLSEVFAIGPGIRYSFKNMVFSLRSQWEMAAKNKTEGYNVWAKFIYAF